jgi:hypothetical protein
MKLITISLFLSATASAFAPTARTDLPRMALAAHDRRHFLEAAFGSAAVVLVAATPVWALEDLGAPTAEEQAAADVRVCLLCVSCRNLACGFMARPVVPLSTHS